MAFDPVTPLSAVDCVIISSDGGKIVVIDRKYPPLGCALPGGFVDVGETCAQAAVRETKEETGLDCRVVQFLGFQDDPDRDPRRHVIAFAYLLQVNDPSTEGDLKGMDDAANARWVSPHVVMEKLVLGHDNAVRLAFPDIGTWREYI